MITLIVFILLMIFLALVAPGAALKLAEWITMAVLYVVFGALYLVTALALFGFVHMVTGI